MRPIPPKLRKIISEDPYYKRCARAGAECRGRITWEHALTYAGKQINELFSLLPLCVYHHLGPGLHKPTNQLIPLSRATSEDLAKYPRLDFQKLKQRLSHS